MYNEKPYLNVNREERNYCFLFAHSLLMSSALRESFGKLAQERFGISLDPTALDVYVEAAVLRDYWYDLGDPMSYDDETGRKRREVVEQILRFYGKSPDLIDKLDLFWTKSVGSKLWYPSHWNIDALKYAGLEDLVQVKWAFNAKPDILIMTPESALVIEAKVESAEGCKVDREREFTYSQLKTQELIIKIWQLLVPEFKNKKIELALLNIKGGDKGFAWSEIVELVEKSDVDDFTCRSLAMLNRYYNTEGRR